MEITDFTLLLSDPLEDRSTLRFALQVPTAGGLAAITEPLHCSCDLARVARAMTHPGPGRALLLATGLELGRALFPGIVAARFREALATTRLRGGGIRVRILAGTVLQQLPWEYVVLPPEHGEATPHDLVALMPHVSLVRDQEGAPRLRWDSPPAIRVLGCVATPRTRAAIEVERERQCLETALERPNVELHWTDGGIRPSIALGAADVFHFAGHGGFVAPGPDPGHGLLIFDDGVGGEDRVRAGDLALVLRELGVRIAVLNACDTAMRDDQRWWSSAAAALLNAGIGCVVAMQQKILDTSALTFATAFYGALADRRSLDDAVRLGRLAVFSQDDFGWGTPVLYLSTHETVTFAPRANVISTSEPRSGPRPESMIALPGWTGSARHLVWSIDGARIAASDGKGTCGVWSRNREWQSEQRLQVAAIDRSGGWIDTRLVIAQGDRLYLLDGSTRPLAHLELAVRSVLPLDSMIACIDAAGSAYLYEPDGCLVDRMPLGPEPWSVAAESPHDALFAVATATGRLAIWGSSRKLVTATVGDGITALAFATADRLVAVLASGCLAAFAIEKRKAARLADVEIPTAARAPLSIARRGTADTSTVDGVIVHRLAIPGLGPATALTAMAVNDDVHCLAWSPDGTRLAVGTSTAILIHDLGGSVRSHSLQQTGES